MNKTIWVRMRCTYNMLFMVLYKSLYNKTEYRKENKLILFYHSVHHHFSYIKALAACIEAVKAHDVKLWLWDYRHAGTIRITEQAWMKSEWCPFAPYILQLEKIAEVGSMGVFHCNCPDNFTFLFQAFEDYQVALEWILSEKD